MKCPCQVHSGVLATTLVLHCDSGRTSVKEVAAILKTTRQQVRKMIQNEELPAVKVGREWRVSSEALQDFLTDPV